MFVRLFSIMMCLVITISPGASHFANSIPWIRAEAVELPIEVEVVKPICTVYSNSLNAGFEYDSKNNLLKKICGENITTYTERNGRIIDVKGDEYKINFMYALVEGNEICTGMRLNNCEYNFDYSDGNVIAIKQGEKVICEYDYTKYFTIPEIVAKTEEDSRIGHINPIRYQGWFFDEELETYYLGSGIFYDAKKQMFLQDKVKTVAKSRTQGDVEIMATTSDIIENAYQDLWNDKTYGSKTLQPGDKWYSSLSQVEVIARCIYAENTRSDRQGDRIAETVVIMNRMVRDRKTAYGVVTAPSQFSTICSSNPGSNSLSAKSKNDKVWQQASLLACIAYYGKTRSDIPYFFRIPNGISTQYNFRGLSSVSVSYVSDGRISVAGTTRKNVVVTGYGPVNTRDDVSQINKLSGYNIFFNDVND